MAADTSGATRDKALQAALSQIEKSFGKGAIMKLGKDAGHQQIEVIKTGSIGLDIALGAGGLPKGRIIEIYGPESSGKTTLTLEAIAQCQAAGGTCAFIDAEHALDPVYAAKLGCNIDELLISQPDNGEAALEIGKWLEARGRLHQPIASLSLGDLEAMASNAISRWIVMQTEKLQRAGWPPEDPIGSFLLG